ncbi:enoyl-CoA hydratase [Tateyamaria pelophila]|uniref:enoyl-CoA hydratase n=1 Tax=Tateyamaria pelophila TaxID=328415 RepID=UPI001CBBAAB4|nr:enoyl-CoA hydratase [Tateyamaria pelophila]
MTQTETYADGRLQLVRSGNVAAITFNAPEKHNAMSLGMWQALGDICETLSTDDSLRVLTLTGAGDRAFVAGADISEFGETRSNATSAAAYNAAVTHADDMLEMLPVPTLALIRGYCIGGGLGIAMRCDLRLARDDARFAITPAKLSLGYGYDGVAQLHRRLGHAVTADLLFSGRKLSAADAQAKGICDFVYPREAFDAACTEYVNTLVGNAPLTLRAVKSALTELAKPEAARDRTATGALVRACFDSADYAEGQRAFAEKRAPQFKGR